MSVTFEIIKLMKYTFSSVWFILSCCLIKEEKKSKWKRWWKIKICIQTETAVNINIYKSIEFILYFLAMKSVRSLRIVFLQVIFKDKNLTRNLKNDVKNYPYMKLYVTHISVINISI